VGRGFAQFDSSPYQSPPNLGGELQTPALLIIPVAPPAGGCSPLVGIPTRRFTFFSNSLIWTRSVRSTVKITFKGRVGLAAALVTLALAAFAFLQAGRLLVVEDPLKPATAVVVFGGGVPFRAMEASRVYKQGWAREVWLTKGGVFPPDAALANLEIERTPEYMYSRMVLDRLGVPSAAIRVLPERTPNTAEEVRTVARGLDRFGGDRVILVTSSYHTRRVKSLWRKLVGDHPEAIVRYTPDEDFEAGRWWRDSASAMRVTREWFSLLNGWFGFPMKSEQW